MSAHQCGGSLLIIMCFILTNSSSADPCNSYTVLDEPWRATNYSDTMNKKCDDSVSWAGWYRLMYNGWNVQMPESCVNIYMCGANAPLWMSGTHPQLQDGVVTRQICGHWEDNCCYLRPNPIRVKACPGNYYVYEFVSPSACWYAYCADITTLKPALYPKIKQLVRLRLSSAEDFKQSSTSEIFLNQLKEELLRKGLPTNITLHLKSISKQKNVKSETREPGIC
ncbi:pancreatic secretory granule membrane major glycoprotein GP2-like [Colossoma macropomum]|uniref:pancreatic secretory granule membrane major glycoprotein GP2-like n=1 Tax=Colossoma macropomum TaxID=42526 RepID=UPI001864F9A4|nr:pancreatic secretory granule membrane major glycoprotein GP2-like [Colossoma macropomum]